MPRAGSARKEPATSFPLRRPQNPATALGKGPTPPRQLPFAQARKALQYRAFRRFLLSMLFFTAGMQMSNVAQGWLVYELTGSNFALGLVTAMWSVTMLIFSPIGGVIADRVDRRTLLMVTWGGVAIVLALLTVLIFTDRIQVWHLMAASLFNGVMFAFNIPTRLAFVGQIIGDTGLMGAMALISMVFNFSGIIFPLMGGGIIDVASVGGAYALIALLYACAVVVMWRTPGTPKPERSTRTGIFPEMGAGLLVLRQNSTLAWLWCLGLAAVVLGQSYNVLLPDFAATTLNVPASGLGLLFTMLGTGAFMGNMLVASLDSNVRLGRLMMSMGAIAALMLIALSMVSNFAVALVVLFFLGLAGMPFFTINQTLVQILSPSEARGRVQSLYMITWAAQPLGSIPMAGLADRAGVSAPMLIVGVAMLVVMVSVAIFRPRLLTLQGRKPTPVVAHAASPEAASA